jgi:phosphotransferase system enzyme I (PtsP)
MPHNAKRTPDDMASPLLMLRRIRDVMLSPESAQARLNELVNVIANEMHSEVCSVYLLRAGDILELFASKGLNPNAVHLTRLQIGEGLVGEIAATASTLNLADASSHPKFVYKPETGEEIYHSFIGLPIMQGGRVVGVLVVQRKASSLYTEDQIEVLQTVAMVLSELHSSGKLVSKSEISEGSGESMVSNHLNGLKLAPGIARAPALVHRKQYEIKMTVADDPNIEEARLSHALVAFQESVDRLLKEAEAEGNKEQSEIMETYQMFAHDKGWLSQISEAIHSGLTAEAAVARVKENLHERMSKVESEYIRERIQDLEDVSNRLMEHLSGLANIKQDLPEEFILVVSSIGPAELLEYGRRRIRGLVLEEGSATSHVVVIARALEIPVVGRVSDITSLVENGDPVIINGDTGDVFVKPTDKIIQSVEEDIRHRRERSEVYETLRQQEPRTTDGTLINLYCNAGLFVDVKHLGDVGVMGIGLYRTELPYMISNSMPDVESQQKIYSKITKQVHGKRVIFRTFDIGGDKQLPYFPIDDEENPAMGWRATRIGIDRPAILRRQLRALIHAASGQALDVMFPFITQAREIDEVRKLIALETERATREGIPLPHPIRVGAMIEVPSILWQLPALLKRVDFVSIGSNDLLQFFFACDRGSTRIGDRYDTLSPEVLRVLHHICRECEIAKVELSFCGEMARKPLEAMALIGLGLRNLSLPTTSLGPIKAMIRSLRVSEIRAYMHELMGSDATSVRAKLETYARDHGLLTD